MQADRDEILQINNFVAHSHVDSLSLADAQQNAVRVTCFSEFYFDFCCFFSTSAAQNISVMLEGRDARQNENVRRVRRLQRENKKNK